MKTLILLDSDLHVLVRRAGLDYLMDAVIDKLTSYLVAFDSSSFQMPARMGFVDTAGDSPSCLEWMPVSANRRDVALKVVAYNPGNPVAVGLPTVVGTNMLFDSRTGCVRLLCDGTFLTAVRTGAASAVASRLLAHEGSSTLGIIGCGAQAVTQVHALSRSFPLRRILFFDTDLEAMRSFPARIKAFGIEAFPSNPLRIAEESDLLCTATSVEPGCGPVFPVAEPKPWLHVNAVGADLPGKFEVPLEHLRRSFVVTDFLAQARIEGECQQLGATEAVPELHVITKDSERFSHYKNTLTVFDSTGMALEDFAALEAVLELAVKYDVGRSTVLHALPPDPKNPYCLVSEAGLGSSRVDIMWAEAV